MGFTAGNLKTPPNNGGNSPSQEKIDLTKEEIEFLLTLIKNSNFSGNMIEIIYNLVYKLQKHYQKINK